MSEGNSLLATVRAAAGTDTVTRADHDAAVRASERARIKAITSSPEAEGREAQALALATATALTLEEAVAIMAASPRDTGLSSFVAAKEGRKELNLHPEAAKTAGDTQEEIDAFWGGVASRANARAGLKDPVR